MMSRTGPPCDRYFGHFGSWYGQELAILESLLPSMLGRSGSAGRSVFITVGRSMSR